MRLHVINLDRSPERMVAFRTCNGHLRDVVRFAAVDGRALECADVVRRGTIREEILQDYTAGALGCALSHLALWNEAIRSEEPVTISEDDAIFNLGFEGHAHRAMRALPADWDIIFWGYNCGGLLAFEPVQGAFNCVALLNHQQSRRNIEVFRTTPFPVQPYRLWQVLGLVCYSISPKGARSLKERCLPLQRKSVHCLALQRAIPNQGLDVALMEHYAQVQAFVTFPPLVLSPNDRAASTVQGDAPAAAAARS